MRISATVMAAGQSTRMDNTNKLLLIIDGNPMVKRVCESLLTTGFDPVVVVTGFEKNKVEAALNKLELQFTHNSHWADGMATSIFSGLVALPYNTDGNLIALGDMPFVSVETLEKLKNSFISHEGKHIIYPKHDGQQGNPVLFPEKYFDEIMSSTGDRGCKRVLRKYPDDAVPVPIDSNEVILDCDTNEDYLKLKYHSEELNVQT